MTIELHMKNGELLRFEEVEDGVEHLMEALALKVIQVDECVIPVVNVNYVRILELEGE